MNILDNIKRWSPKRKDYHWIVLLSVIVLLPNILLAIFGSDLDGNFGMKLGFLFISFCLFFTPSLFLKAKVFFLVQGVFVLIAPFEIAHIYMSKMPITKAFLMTIFDTNIGEMTELLSSYILPILVYVAILIVYFYITIRKIENSYLIPPLKVRLPLLFGVFFILIAGYAYFYIFWTGDDASVKDSMKEATRTYKGKFKKTYPYSLFINLSDVLEEKKEIRHSKEYLETVSFGATKKTPIDQKEVYVFVIGETARYENFSVNGYERQTTPLLKKTENLVTFSDYFSGASLTLLSVPTFLTDVTFEDFDNYYKHKSFVDAFKEAGFKTYWIANQSVENGFIRRIAEDTNDFYFSTVDFDANDSYDELLWPHLDKILQNDDQKVLIVLHTLGSHYRYNFRYPKSFDVFKPSLEGSFSHHMQNAEYRDLLVNTYDNSIYYTDYFLANTIKKIDSLNCVSSLIFVGDHGENLYDTEDKLGLHGGSIVTTYDFHVPLFVWMSNDYRNIYPEKAQSIESNKDKMLNSLNMFHSVLDIADITHTCEKPTRSFASGMLQEDSVRYIIKTDFSVVKAPELKRRK